MKNYLCLFLSVLMLYCAACTEDAASSSQVVTTKDTTLPAASVGSAAPPLAADSSLQPTALSQEFTGTYVDARSRNEEENPVDGRLLICPAGKAVYTVFDNQLIYIFVVRQKETGPQTAILEFYFEEGDRGRGFANADLKEPARGTLVATVALTAEYEITFDYKAKAFIESVRKWSPKDVATPPFPKAFYYASRMDDVLAGCDRE